MPQRASCLPRWTTNKTWQTDDLPTMIRRSWWLRTRKGVICANKGRAYAMLWTAASDNRNPDIIIDRWNLQEKNMAAVLWTQWQHRAKYRIETGNMVYSLATPFPSNMLGGANFFRRSPQDISCISGCLSAFGSIWQEICTTENLWCQRETIIKLPWLIQSTAVQIVSLWCMSGVSATNGKEEIDSTNRLSSCEKLSFQNVLRAHCL